MPTKDNNDYLNQNIYLTIQSLPFCVVKIISHVTKVNCT